MLSGNRVDHLRVHLGLLLYINGAHGQVPSLPDDAETDPIEATHRKLNALTSDLQSVTQESGVHGRRLGECCRQTETSCSVSVSVRDVSCVRSCARENLPRSVGCAPAAPLESRSSFLTFLHVLHFFNVLMFFHFLRSSIFSFVSFFHFAPLDVPSTALHFFSVCIVLVRCFMFFVTWFFLHSDSQIWLWVWFL